MFSYFYSYSTPDFKQPISKKNGMEKIKISKNHPCEIITIAELTAQNLKLGFAYVRMDQQLLYFNSKNNTSTHIELEDEQLQLFDKEFKPSTTPRKLTLDELKKITNLTGHTQDSLYIELLYSGYYVDPNKNSEFTKLLDRLPFHIEYHEVPAKYSWNFFYGAQPDITVGITIPFTDVQKENDAFIELKGFVQKWQPQWFPILQDRINEIIEEKYAYQFKDEKQIPVLFTKQTKENILVAFLYKGKGMTVEKTQKIDELTKKLEFNTEQYCLPHGGLALEVQIPIVDIQNESSKYTQLKTFVLLHDETALDSILAYENNWRKGDPILSASLIL